MLVVVLRVFSSDQGLFVSGREDFPVCRGKLKVYHRKFLGRFLVVMAAKVLKLDAYCAFQN
jgi:hypothetical protein